MTAELIQRFATEHGISTIRAMVAISELLGNKKDPTPMESSKDMISHFTIEELGWNF